jgi:hypothetical protein
MLVNKQCETSLGNYQHCSLNNNQWTKETDEKCLQELPPVLQGRQLREALLRLVPHQSPNQLIPLTTLYEPKYVLSFVMHREPRQHTESLL